MRIPRVIPTLLLLDEQFVKTVGYAEPRYVGDPTNIINLFNQFEVDEIVLLDIGATPQRVEPSYDFIGGLAAECWVPLTYGGGIRTMEHARRVLAAGVEKVILGTIAADDPSVIRQTASVFGSQAVVVSVDAKRASTGYEVVVDHAERVVGTDPAAYARAAEAMGAGEIIVNAVHADGRMSGYDLDLIRLVTSSVRVPVIASCGAGSRAQLVDPVREAGASAVAAGSVFVFRGPQRGVLVNFPSRGELEGMFSGPGDDSSRTIGSFADA